MDILILSILTLKMLEIWKLEISKLTHKTHEKYFTKIKLF